MLSTCKWQDGSERCFLFCDELCVYTETDWCREQPTGPSLLTRLCLFAGINDVNKLLALVTVLLKYISIPLFFLKGLIYQSACSFGLEACVWSGFCMRISLKNFLLLFPSSRQKELDRKYQSRGRGAWGKTLFNSQLMSAKAENFCVFQNDRPDNYFHRFLCKWGHYEPIMWAFRNTISGRGSDWSCHCGNGLGGVAQAVLFWLYWFPLVELIK